MRAWLRTFSAVLAAFALVVVLMVAFVVVANATKGDDAKIELRTTSLPADAP